MKIFTILFTFSLFASEENLFDETPQPPSVSNYHFIQSGSLDFRYGSLSKDLDSLNGGEGKNRHGTATPGRSGSELSVPQIHWQLEILKKQEKLLHFHLSNSDLTKQKGNIGIIEGYLTQSHGNHKIKMGILYPPISLEHNQIGWNTKYSITPSAINTWIGEEVRTTAIEYSYNINPFKLTFAPFAGNDASGKILSWRGFAFSDYQSPYGGNLKIQSGNPIAKSEYAYPFKEIDGRLGVYGGGEFENEQFRINLLYMNNLANFTVDDGNDYAWNTYFWNFGLEYKWNNFQFISQFMKGHTGMGVAQTVVKNDFLSWFVLLHSKFRKHGISVRYDKFEIEDLDNWKSSTNVWDRNNEKGDAYLISYQYPFFSGIFFIEYLKISSKRAHKSDPNDDQFLANYRVMF